MRRPTTSPALSVRVTSSGGKGCSNAARLIRLALTLSAPGVAGWGSTLVLTRSIRLILVRGGTVQEREWRESWGRLSYLGHLLAGKGPAKEVRLFDLGRHFMPEYRSLAEKLVRRQYFGAGPILRFYGLRLVQYLAIAAFVVGVRGRKSRLEREREIYAYCVRGHHS